MDSTKLIYTEHDITNKKAVL